MNRALDSSLRFVALTAIVATIMCLPVGALLAGMAYLFGGVSGHSFITFGERLPAAAGLLAWWGLACIPAAIYAAFCLRS